MGRNDIYFCVKERRQRTLKIRGDWFTLISSNGWFTARTKRAYYDLSKSVSDNLDGPELLELIANLLDIKE